jgi:hypothetical protein
MHTCPCRCGGEGRAQLRRKVRFKVPCGVVDGQVLRVKGQGHSGKYGGVPGDLLVRLQVRAAAAWWGGCGGCGALAAKRVWCLWSAAGLGVWQGCWCTLKQAGVVSAWQCRAALTL